MRFKGYILNEGRSKLIYEDDAIYAIKSKCQGIVKAMRKRHFLYRGVSGGSTFSYIEPKKHNRVSANTSNIYTLVIDNHPKWKGYPKRSKSIICANTPGGASSYGSVYHVFPVDGANYGICPQSDLWMSFMKTLKVYTLLEFNETILSKIAMHFLGMKNPGNFGNYIGLKKLFKEMDALYAEKMKDENEQFKN